MTRAALVLVALPLIAGSTAGCHGSRRHAPKPAPSTAQARQRGRPDKSFPPEQAIAAVIASRRGSGLEAGGLFPHHISERCVIHGGAPAPGLRIEENCSMRVTYNWGRRRPDVVFVES